MGALNLQTGRRRHGRRHVDTQLRLCASTGSLCRSQPLARCLRSLNCVNCSGKRGGAGTMTAFDAACMAAPAAAAAAAAATPAAVGYSDFEEFNDAWHTHCGYHPGLRTHEEMLAVLNSNSWRLRFALRCAATPEEFFFGPAKEALRAASLRIRVTLLLQRFRRCVWRVAYLSTRLAAARDRAAERLFGPGGQGYLECQASFAAALDQHAP